MSGLKSKMARSKDDGACEMDVTYITERIIVMSFPWEGYEDIYRQSVKEASRMLNDKHGDGYLILNISEKRSILNKCNKQVLDFGWPQRLAPPLERLCGVCKAVDSWLNTDPRHVAVIHSKGERGRSGVIVASYMHYSNICASADQALDRFAMKKFYDDKLGGVTQPSQRRYVHYFAGLLSGGIKMNSSPIYLNHVIIHGVPDFDGRGSCRPFIKVYQGMEPVFVSGIYQVTANQPRICISLDPSLSLKGDVLVKCFHKRPRSNIRDIVFRCQFHTCAVSNHGMTLQKHELDDACDDPRFPDASKVELMFSAHPVKFKRFDLTQEKSTESSVDPLERWDSYENFNSLVQEDSYTEEVTNEPAGGSRVRVLHLQPNQGPLDGSLYATVSKVRSERVNGGLHNGPLTQSADSGISSTSGTTGSANVTSQSTVPNMTSVASHGQLSNTHQLDNILSELLGDGLISQDALTPGAGCVTTQSGNSRTTVSWNASETGPKRSMTLQKDFRDDPAPGTHVESSIRRHEETTSSHAPRSRWNTSPTMGQRDRSQSVQESSYLTSESRTERRTSERVTSPIGFSPSSSPLPSRLYTLPYKVETSATEQNQQMQQSSRVNEHRGYASDTEDSLSWLERQQAKLQAKRDDRTWHKRSEQEKRLVAELRSAQNSLNHKRAVSDVEEDTVMQQYTKVNRSYMQNGITNTFSQEDRYSTSSTVPPKRPPSPVQEALHPVEVICTSQESERARIERTTQESERARIERLQHRSQSVPVVDSRHDSSLSSEQSYWVSGLERPPFTTHQTKYTFSVSPPKPAVASNLTETVTTIKSKPPPSPGGRTSAPTSPIIPARGTSSKEAVMRSRSLSSQGRPISRQLSEPELFELPPRPTPPPYATLYPQRTSATLPPRKLFTPQSAGGVHRRTLTTEEEEVTVTTKKAYEPIDLEKTLNEAFQSIQTYNSGTESDDPFARQIEPQVQAPIQAPKPVESQRPIQEEPIDAVDRVPRNKSAAPPPPPFEDEEEEFEEEVISLQPIGPGMQPLEPNDPATLKRAMTPSFPVQDEEEEIVSLAPVGAGIRTLEARKRSPVIVSGSMTTGRMRHHSLDHLQQPQQQLPMQQLPMQQLPQQPPGEWTRTIETRTVKSRNGQVMPMEAETRTEQLLPPGGVPVVVTPSYSNTPQSTLERQKVSPFGVPLMNTMPRMNSARSVTPQMTAPLMNARSVTPQMTAPLMSAPPHRMASPRPPPSPVDPELEAVERSIESQLLNAKPRAGSRPDTAPPYDPTYATISEATKRSPRPRQGAVTPGGTLNRNFQYNTLSSGGQHVQQISPGISAGQPSPTPGFPVQQQRAYTQQSSAPGLYNTGVAPMPVETREQTITEFQRFPVTYPKKQQSQATEDISDVRRFQTQQRSPSCPPGATAATSGGTGTLVKKTVTRTVQRKEYDIDATSEGRSNNSPLRNISTDSDEIEHIAEVHQPQNQSTLQKEKYLQEPMQQQQMQNQSTLQKEKYLQEPMQQQQQVHQQYTQQQQYGQQNTEQHIQQQQYGQQYAELDEPPAVVEQPIQKQQKQNVHQQQQFEQALQNNFKQQHVQKQQHVVQSEHIQQPQFEQVQQQNFQQQHVQQQYQEQHGQQQNLEQHSTVAARGGVNVYPANGSFHQQSFVQQQSSSSSGMQNGHAMGALTVDTGQQYKGSGLSPASVSTHSPTSPAVGTFTQFSQQTSYGSVTPGAQSMTGQNSPSIYFGQSRRGSLTSLNDGADIVHHTPKFVRDTSKFWYKPNIGRDEAIAMLKDKQPGTFIVRDSNSFPGAYGLALKVAQVPPNVQSKGDPQAELVRHFLIEPTPKGVKLKGCSNEPVFGSLAALVYQHSITPLALPCKLLLSETDGRAHDSEEELDLILESDADPAEFDTLDGTLPSSAAQLLAQGAACNVVYVGTYDMESLTGPEAIAKAVEQALTSSVIPTVVHFKVSSQGITLTDNKRKLFFRRHYAVNSVTFCSMDPGNHRWTSPVEGHQLPTNAWVFGFVAKKTGSGHDNACHIFAELDSEQPATAIVNFVAKVMIGQGTGKVTRS